MNSHGNDLLLLAGKVIAILLQAIMAISAAALVITLPVVTIFSGDIVEGFADGSGVPVSELPMGPLLGLLLIALAIVAALFTFFGRLRAIIDTVGKGDPFAPANAERLNLMAWLLLGVQVLLIPASGLGLLLAKWADQFEHQNITIDAGLDLTGVLMVLVLFILARVFHHGAAMREDLEGTV